MCRYSIFSTRTKHPVLTRSISYLWNPFSAPQILEPRLIRVESERNFTLRGPGTIAPGGSGGQSPDFYSALHVRSTVGVQLTAVRIHCTAWWWCSGLHNLGAETFSAPGK